MSITSIDDYLGAARQIIDYTKTVSKATSGGNASTYFEIAGSPGAGTLAASSTTGVVPVDTDVGYPKITNFAGGATGYLSRFSAFGSVAGRIILFDRLWVGGTYAFASGTTVVALNGDPTPLNRVPDNDWSLVEAYFELVTATTGTQTLSLVYTDQAGVSRTSPTVSAAASTAVGRLYRVPLFAGGTGIQKVESVVVTGGTVGTWNVVLLRRLADIRIAGGNYGDTYDMFRVGMPRVYDASALICASMPDSTTGGTIDAKIEIASK